MRTRASPRKTSPPSTQRCARGAAKARIVRARMQRGMRIRQTRVNPARVRTPREKVRGAELWRARAYAAGESAQRGKPARTAQRARAYMRGAWRDVYKQVRERYVRRGSVRRSARDACAQLIFRHVRAAYAIFIYSLHSSSFRARLFDDRRLSSTIRYYV